MPILAFLPAILGAAGSIGSSLINRRRSSSGNNSVLLPPGLDTNALISAIGQQKDLAGFLTGEGKKTLTEGHDTLSQPLSFYQTLLGGDRTALTQTLAPEIAAINAQFRAPLREAELTGRGSSLQPDLEAGRQSAISNLFFKERPAAADKLTQIAQNLMGLGTQQLGMGGNILGDVAHEQLSYNSLIRGLQAQEAQNQTNTWGSLGASLGPLLTQILGGGGGSSSGGNVPVPNVPLPGIPAEPPIQDPTVPDYGRLSPAVLNAITMSGYQEPSINASWLHDILDLGGRSDEQQRPRPWWEAVPVR